MTARELLFIERLLKRICFTMAALIAACVLAWCINYMVSANG